MQRSNGLWTDRDEREYVYLLGTHVAQLRGAAIERRPKAEIVKLLHAYINEIANREKGGTLIEGIDYYETMNIARRRIASLSEE